MVTVCRAQFIPAPGETTMLAQNLQFHMCAQPELRCHWRLHRFFDRFESYITSPVLCSHIMDIMRSAPYSVETIAELSRGSWAKEISTLESDPLPPRMNFNVFFTPSAFETQSLLPSLPINPSASYHIYSILCRWRDGVKQAPIYPRLNSKIMSTMTIKKWQNIEKRQWNREAQGEFSHKVAEKYLHDTGERLESESEIAQRFYRSGLTPRSYFRMGGRALHLSKHVQGPAGDLVDLFAPTNHTSRLNPTRIQLTPEEYLLIWDLRTFTSNHHEVRYFMRRLAEFCIGTTVTIMDAEHGFIEEDLGMLLYAYNQMNDNPEYSMEKVDDHYRDLVLVHHIAGFLGVFGNLMFSTFLHGASVYYLVGDERRLNVAGDDGHCPIRRESTTDQAFSVIRANGVVELTKLFKTSEEGAICLKRGLVQEGQTLLQKIMHIMPSLSAIMDVLDVFPSHFDHSTKTRDEKRGTVGTEILRFLASMRVAVGVTDEEKEFLVLFLTSVYICCDLPREGCAPQFGGRYLCPVLPETIVDFERDALRYLLLSHWKGAALVPKRLMDVEIQHDVEPLVWEMNNEVVSPSSQYYSYMETLGYLVSEPEMIMVVGEDGFDRICREFTEFSARIYTYKVIAIPPFSFTLQYLSERRPTEMVSLDPVGHQDTSSGEESTSDVDMD